MSGRVELIGAKKVQNYSYIRFSILMNVTLVPFALAVSSELMLTNGVVS